MKIKAIIFDYDGVIHNTFQFHRGNIKTFFGVDMGEDDFRDLHNGNFFTNTNKQLENVDWLSYRDFVQKPLAALIIEEKTKSTILELGKNYDLFIVSSGGTKGISDYLGINGIYESFKEVLGLESHRSKVDKFNFLFQKYSLTAENCIFVTDTLGDILEANRVGIKTIAVDFGYHPKETLEKGNPFKTISEFDEILNLVS